MDVDGTDDIANWKWSSLLNWFTFQKAIKHNEEEMFTSNRNATDSAAPKRADTRSGWYELDEGPLSSMDFDNSEDLGKENSTKRKALIQIQASESIHRWLQRSKLNENSNQNNPLSTQLESNSNNAFIGANIVLEILQNIMITLWYLFFWWYELAVFIVRKLLKVVSDFLSVLKSHKSNGEIQKLYLQLDNAKTYREWYQIAYSLDELEGRNQWKVQPLLENKSLYDVDALRARLLEFARLYQYGDVNGLMFAMRAGLVRNLGGICNPELHQKSHVGTKRDVEDYVNVVVFLLKRIAVFSPSLKALQSKQHKHALHHEKLTFFNETRHAYGRTALMLSGGASMGLLHLGVIKALLENGLLPRVICGTSAGAIIASLVCTLTNQELFEMYSDPNLSILYKIATLDAFDHVSSMKRIQRFVRQGVICNVELLKNSIRENLGDVTFEEAYLKTKRILNISVSPQHSGDPPLLLNYLSAPHVLIWSAATASCAIPVVFSAVQLVAKTSDGSIVPYHPEGLRFVDGSFKSDIPLTRIAELFNVNHFVVSQVNPHVAPFHKSRWIASRMMKFIISEFYFRYCQLIQLNIMPSILKRLFPIFVQPYSGDVTIAPEIQFRDWLRLFSHADMNELQDAIKRGEQMTFPKLDMIRNHCLIELTLQKCLDRLIRKQNSTPEQKSRFIRRVPSWLWNDYGSLKGGGNSEKGVRKYNENEGKLGMKKHNVILNEVTDDSDIYETEWSDEDLRTC